MKLLIISGVCCIVFILLFVISAMRISGRESRREESENLG